MLVDGRFKPVNVGTISASSNPLQGGVVTHAETVAETSPSDSRYLHRVLMTLSSRSKGTVWTTRRARTSQATAAAKV
jgi:hypothetical protein